MTKKTLDEADVDTGLDQLSRGCMPEHVWGEMAAKAGVSARLREESAHRRGA